MRPCPTCKVVTIGLSGRRNLAAILSQGKLDFAQEIEAELIGGVYHAIPEELAGVDRGLRAATERRFATDQQVEEAFAKFRRV